MKIKPILISFGFILISTLSIKAQSFKFGVLAGFDLPKTSIPGVYDTIYILDPMISFNFNGHIGYKSAGFFGLSIEPGFVQKGGLQSSDHHKKTRIQFNYIPMPILVDL
jgi:hypothetical protein